MAENPEPLGPIKKPKNIDNRIPVGGTVDQVLKKVSATDYDVIWDDVTGDGSSSNTFETVSKNIKAYPCVITYDGDDIDFITYDLGSGNEIIKTFNYTLGTLTSLVLSGDTPAGIELTKTFNYTGENLTSIVYT